MYKSNLYFLIISCMEPFKIFLFYAVYGLNYPWAMEDENWPRLNEWPLHDKLLLSLTVTLQAGWFQPITSKSTFTDYSKWSNSKNASFLGQKSRQQVRFTLSRGFLGIHSMNFIPMVCFNNLETWRFNFLNCGC